ncbi:hypothetical protein D1815_16360 [Aquimarina sp. AD1]|uniref:hypothetical protein n=1 Tax=Aquimarina TaxID=290174 RepID=UPI00040301A6|nr:MULTISPECIES: hypothetical protein [Aquimarina]AXT57240.1 hypothetical protein D1815_16360 [Aquimarina sp. AD1]RKN18561.1 hypothetical protein D7035_14205 [Aquimarina sp. AD1]
MKKQIKKLALFCIIALVASCSKPELDNTDETLATPKVEIVESAKDWGFPGDDEWQIPHLVGVYGPSSLDAYEVGTYSYFLPKDVLASLPSSLRGFRIRFWAENTFGFLIPIQTDNVGASTSSLSFPVYGSGSTTRWRIEYMVYNKKTGSVVDSKFKDVLVTN